MKPKNREEMDPQSREHYCWDHGVPKTQTAHGRRACPFCEREEWLDATTTAPERDYAVGPFLDNVVVLVLTVAVILAGIAIVLTEVGVFA